MDRRWRWFLPGYLWALPATLIGLALALPNGARRPRWSDGCLELEARRMIGRPLAQTWGWLIFYTVSIDDAPAIGFRDNYRLRAHERAHVVQGFVGGPLFLIAYAACFVWLYLARLDDELEWRDWRPAYRAIPFERWARAAEKRPDAWGRKVER
jgi:hypothetical protein